MSFMTKAADAVPALVSKNWVGAPRSEMSLYRLNSIFRPLVVVIVLPPMYAVCRVEAEAGHLITLSEPSRHKDEDADTGVVNPIKEMKESASVVITMSFVPSGLK